MSCKIIPITEGALLEETGDEILVFPCGNGWGAIYAEEEPDEFPYGALGFCDFDAPILAAADLVTHFPREVRP